jgi:hypothetical protein
MTEWVRIRSWHLLRPTRSLPDTAWTRCGRKVADPVIVPDLPLDAKSCETCLRLAAHDDEARA